MGQWHAGEGGTYGWCVERLVDRARRTCQGMSSLYALVILSAEGKAMKATRRLTGQVRHTLQRFRRRKSRVERAIEKTESGPTTRAARGNGGLPEIEVHGRGL